MTNILLIASSPRGAASHSTTVAKALVDSLRIDRPGATVTLRDLGREPLPHVGEDFVAGLGIPTERWTDAQRAAIARSDQLVRELLGADVLVIASAMINFAVSSTLKSWFDHVIRAGLTFRYSSDGRPEGLATGKKVYLVMARGGVYTQGPMQASNFQEPHLRTLLGFMGMTDVETIAIEGVAFGPEAANKALSTALAKVQAIARVAA